MTVFQEWAADWKLPPEAVRDLAQRLVVTSRTEVDLSIYRPGSEAFVQSRVQLDAGYRDDVLLFRNNVGVLKDINDRPVRYGLANDSARVNKAIKSGDVIGLWRRTIRPEHIGQQWGVFLSIENKKFGWVPSPTDAHEAAQSAWANLINSYGGIARFYAGQGNLFTTLEQSL